MANCMVISLYLWQGQTAVRCEELPPLSLPQQLRGLGYACFISRQNSGFYFHTNHRSFYL